MRIGTLTLHLPFNYGNALQMLSPQQMSARLRDFTRDFGRPEILTARPDVEAMRQLSVTPRLRELVDRSKSWLKEALSA